MKRWQLWLGIVISALFLILALRGVDLPAAWRATLTTQKGYLLAGWGCLLVSYLVRSWRWRIILVPIRQVPLWSVLRVFMAGFLANNVLPARMGEIVRAYALGQTAQLSTAAALGTIAVERVFDVAMALLLLAGGAAFGLLGSVGNSLWLGGMLVGVLALGLLILALWGEPLSDLLERVVGRLSPSWGRRLADLARSFVQGLRSIGSVVRALRVAFWSAASWGLFMAYAYFVLMAFGLSISLAGAAFLLGLAGLGVSIPSAPGSVGTLEYAYILGLQLLGIGDDTTRASFALTYHVLEWVTTCVLGLVCLGQLGLSLGQVSTMAAEPSESQS